MKKQRLHLLISILIIQLVIGNYALATNTHTTDLELSSSQYWSIADGSQTGLDLTGDLTIEAWVKFESNVGGTNAVIVSKYNNVGNQRSYHFSYGGGNDRMSFTWSNDGTNTDEHQSDILGLANGTWYHLAVVHDLSVPQTYFYLNGSAVGSPSTGTKTVLYDGSSTFLVGAYLPGAPTNFLDGTVDDLRVWNDIRTSQEISDNYNCSLDADETNLVAYWRYDNDGLDSHANGNDLTNNNSCTFQSASLPFTDTCSGSPTQEETTTGTSTMIYSTDLSFITGTIDLKDTDGNLTGFREVYLHIPFIVWLILTVVSLWIGTRIVLELIIRFRN